jgi:hypothetical protein
MTAPGVFVTSAASHDAQVSGDGVTWRSVYVGAHGALAPGEHLRIDLAHPITATLDVERSPGVTAERDGRAITALVVEGDRVASWHDAITVTLHEARAHDGEAELLAPPLARGDAVQRVTVGGDGDLRFAPDGAPFEHHVGYWVTAGVSEADKTACDSALDSHPAIDDTPFYVAHADALPVVRGHTSTGADRARAGVLGVTLVSVIVVASLAWGYRRLTGRARVEQAEAILREEFERTGG